MDRVFIVWHVHRIGDESDEKLIGVYKTQEAAAAAVERTRLLAGFRDTPNGFEIAPYDLDKDHWTEGFISWDEASGMAEFGESIT